jgi:hypothetical protein
MKRENPVKKTAAILLAFILALAINGLAYAEAGFGFGVGSRGGGAGFGFGFGHGGVLGTGRVFEDYPFGDERWDPCDEWGTKGPEVRISREQAKELFEKRLAAYGNPDLRLGEILEYDEYYETHVLNKENKVVTRLRVKNDICDDQNFGY